MRGEVQYQEKFVSNLSFTYVALQCIITIHAKFLIFTALQFLAIHENFPVKVLNPVN